MLIKRSTALVAFVVLTLGSVAACGGAPPPGPAGTTATPPPGPPGVVVSAVPVADLTQAEVSAQIQAAGLDAAQARHGVTAHRVVYRTTGPRGEPTTASQLVVLPRNGQSDLRVVSWLHGTSVYRGDVASVKAGSTDRAVAFLFASAGLAVSAPDYIGLGEGPGTHPYGHPGATVSASLDALRSARELAGQQGRTFDERAYVSGFSQGGPATMLLGRALQEGKDPYFTPAALAPVAGPFNASAFEADAASDKVVKSALYLAYFATAWDRLHNIYDSPQQAFREPYAAKVEELFDGNHTPQEIAKTLPGESAALFTDEFLAAVRNPTGVLREELRTMDSTCDWRPNVPVRIYHAAGDRDVVSAHALHCQRQLVSRGTEPRLTDVGDFDHNATVRKAVPQIVQEFTG